MKSITGFIVKGSTGFKLDETFKLWLSKQINGVINFQVVSDKKNRSIQQNRLYWSKWLKAIRYYLPDNILNPMPDNDKELHGFLMFGFGISKGLIKIFDYTDKNNKKMSIPIRPSWEFDKMSATDANEYLSFVESWVIRNIGEDISELILRQERET